MNVILFCIAGIAVLLAAAAVLLIFFRMLRLQRVLEREQQENQRLKKWLTMGSQKADDELEYIRKLRHDLRHYLQIVERSAASPEQLPSDLAAILDHPVPFQGSWTISVLTHYYEKKAENLGISADICLDVNSGLGEVLPDFCLVLSNLLENALEALQREGGGWLRARCISAEGYLSLVVGNASTALLRSVNGRYLSSKAEGRFGIGLSTVQEIARKHGGRAEFTADGKQFLASVFLPYQAPVEEPSSPRETPSSF